MRRSGRNSDRNLEMSNVAPTQCNTKRAASIFSDTFLNPIDMLTDDEVAVADAAAAGEATATATKPRRSLFSGTLKKKIGPMESEDGTGGGGGGRGKKMFNRKNSSSVDIINKSFDATAHHHRPHHQVMAKSGSCSLETKPPPTSSGTFTDHNNPFDEEQGMFIMGPTCTDDLTHLHHMEIEARFILHKLGISTEQLLRAIDSGPRSDIIGAYRIVVHRLQKQVWLNKQAELDAQEETDRPKTNRTCAIL